MNSFLVLLIGAAIWAVTLGGAFIGGMSIGRGQTDEAQLSPISASQGSAPSQGINGASTISEGAPGQGAEFDQSRLQDLRRRIQSGEISQEELNELRQQFRGQGAGPGQFDHGPDGGGQFGGPGGQRGGQFAPDRQGGDAGLHPQNGASE